MLRLSYSPRASGLFGEPQAAPLINRAWGKPHAGAFTPPLPVNGQFPPESIYEKWKVLSPHACDGGTGAGPRGRLKVGPAQREAVGWL